MSNLPFTKKVIQSLWNNFCTDTRHAQDIQAAILAKQPSTPIMLDHFAIIDLPSPHSGIPTLKRLFETLGYEVRGKDYLADKQNDFLWLAHASNMQGLASDALPQVVVADFRLDAMPAAVSNIIERYAAQTKPLPFLELEEYIKASPDDVAALSCGIDLVQKYLTGRDWPLPTIAEFKTVQQFNELLASVLIFGRKPNHFTYAVHLMDGFENLAAFNLFIEKELNLRLNCEGGIIKGTPSGGIMQSSTQGQVRQITLADGTIDIADSFVEFVWRFAETDKPKLWRDYFTHFIGTQANHVIESLYEVADL